MEAPTVTVTFSLDQYYRLLHRLETFFGYPEEETAFHDELIALLKKYEPKDDDERISIMVNEILKKKYEIIDLFCKTFLAIQPVKSEEELLWIFKNMQLVCTPTGFLGEKLSVYLQELPQMGGFEFKLKTREEDV